ncbi:Uncharacterised protein [Mycobacteroides abscessus subsp. abscessus]|nr:Uncharacterised protein [Mycobacteroides abscessus subsp. abscessus]
MTPTKDSAWRTGETWPCSEAGIHPWVSSKTMMSPREGSWNQLPATFTKMRSFSSRVFSIEPEGM